jgi:hypothetical protein
MVGLRITLFTDWWEAEDAVKFIFSGQYFILFVSLVIDLKRISATYEERRNIGWSFYKLKIKGYSADMNHSRNTILNNCLT